MVFILNDPSIRAGHVILYMQGTGAPGGVITMSLFHDLHVRSFVSHVGHSSSDKIEVGNRKNCAESLCQHATYQALRIHRAYANTVCTSSKLVVPLNSP